MRLLLDTHIALWAVADDRRLSASARTLIVDPANEIVVSAASLWEIAIKHALARGTPNDMPISASEALGFFQEAGYELLDIAPTHVIDIKILPMLNSVSFERIIVTKALNIQI